VSILREFTFFKCRKIIAVWATTTAENMEAVPAGVHGHNGEEKPVSQL